MAINGVGHNYDYLGTTTNYIRGEATVREAISKMVKQSANLSISDAGRNMLREMASKFEPDSDYTNVRELTIQNTNEVAWEHYTAMRDISSLTLKDRNYNVEDVMKSIMDTYETRYNEIVKEHENGDREVSYELTGKRSLTLDEDLAGLDEAFKMRLANLEGYNSPQNEVKTQDKAQMFDTKYQKTAVSIMEQAKEKFLVAFKSINYKQGTATSILSDIMKKC